MKPLCGKAIKLVAEKVAKNAASNASKSAASNVAKSAASNVTKSAASNAAKSAASNTAKNTAKNVTKQSFSSESRNAAFRKAKEVNNIPRTEQPIKVTSNHLNKQGKVEQGREYTFKGGKIIRDDANGNTFKDNPSQNRGPHFNDQNKNHFDYPK